MEKKVMTKKGHQILVKKSAPPRENPGYAYGVFEVLLQPFLDSVTVCAFRQ